MMQRSAIGIAVSAFVAALGLAALASDPDRAEKIPSAVDAELYANFLENEVLDIQDLAEGAEVQRRLFNRLTPPGVSLFQPMVPTVAPFDAANFDESFLDGLFGEDKNSVVVYPLSLALNPKTRETLVCNADGDLIAAIPAEKSPHEWPEDADPARVTLRLDLLPSEDVEPYLYAEDRIGGSNVKTATARKTTRRGLSANEFGICNIQKLTNDNMRLTVTNGASVSELYAYAVLHTSSVEVTTCTNEQLQVVTRTNILWHPVSPSFNGIASAWECRTTNLLLTNGVGVWEDANLSSNARVRFYAAANRVDADEDGLTDGAEIFLHRTDPDIADTDGDDMPDGWEVKYGLNARSGLDSSLVCWWKFDDGEGNNTLNSAVDGYHGELQGFSGATNGGWTEEGKYGGAIAFDGNDDWVRIAQETPVLTGGAFTVSAWARLDGSCTSDWPEVISDLMASTYDGYCLGFGSDNKAYAMIGASGWAQDTNALVDQWVWLALEFDGTNMRLHRNGELVRSLAPIRFIPATNGFLSIGNGQDTGYSEHWRGLIDDVRIYRSALGPTALATMYDASDDGDLDDLTNAQEFQLGTSPIDPDTDDDGMPDGWEVNHRLDPLHAAANQDSDADGLTDFQEWGAGTDPRESDTDGDGMPDGWEVVNGLSPLTDDGSLDPDEDGLVNLDEFHSGWMPQQYDSDGDGSSDGFEVINHTYPSNACSGDGDEDSECDDPHGPNQGQAHIANTNLHVAVGNSGTFTVTHRIVTDNTPRSRSLCGALSLALIKGSAANFELREGGVDYDVGSPIEVKERGHSGCGIHDWHSGDVEFQVTGKVPSTNTLEAAVDPYPDDGGNGLPTINTRIDIIITAPKVDLDIRETARPQNRVGRNDPRIEARVRNRILVWANSGSNTITFDLIKPPDITGPVWIQIDDLNGLNSGMPYFARIDVESATFTYTVSDDNDDADLIVRYGADLNSDGILSGAKEIIGTYEVYGVTADDYAESRNNYNFLYLPGALYDLADQLHKRFANGAFDTGDYQPTSISGSATLNATRLSHNFGANLTDAGFVTLGDRQYYAAIATFPIYYYTDDSDASEYILESPELMDGLNSFTAKLSNAPVASTYSAADGGATRSVTLSLDGTTFQFGATGSIGLGRVSVDSTAPYWSTGSITLQVTLNGSMGKGGYIVTPLGR